MGNATDRLGDDVAPEIRALHDGLDMDDFTDGQAKHLVAMKRFTGVVVTAEDFRALEQAEVGYLVPER